MYALTRSDLAEGVWRVDPATGDVTNVVGPETRVNHDPMLENRGWRARSLYGLTADHHGGLLFIAGRSRRVMRFDLSSDELSYLIPPEFGMSTSFQARIRATDIAADGAGNVYVAEMGAQAVYKVDRETGRVRHLASVSGPNEIWFLDSQWSAPEPITVTCGRDLDAPRSAVIEVVDAMGAAIPGAQIVRLESGTPISRVTDERGIATFPVNGDEAWTVAATLLGFRPVALNLKVRRGCVSTERIRLDLDMH